MVTAITVMFVVIVIVFALGIVMALLVVVLLFLGAIVLFLMLWAIVALRRSLRLRACRRIFLRAFYKFIQLAAIQPYAPAFGAVVNFNSRAFRN